MRTAVTAEMGDRWQREGGKCGQCLLELGEPLDQFHIPRLPARVQLHQLNRHARHLRTIYVASSARASAFGVSEACDDRSHYTSSPKPHALRC